MKKLYSNIYKIILLYLVFFLLVGLKRGIFDAKITGIWMAETIGSWMGLLTASFVVISLIGTYQHISRKEYIGGIAITGIILSLINFIGPSTFVGGMIIVLFPFLLIRGTYFWITNKKPHTAHEIEKLKENTNESTATVKQDVIPELPQLTKPDEAGIGNPENNQDSGIQGEVKSTIPSLSRHSSGSVGTFLNKPLNIAILIACIVIAAYFGTLIVKEFLPKSTSEKQMDCLRLGSDFARRKCLLIIDSNKSLYQQYLDSK